MCDGLEVGLLFLNSPSAPGDDESPACAKRDDAIEKSMLEYLRDDLPNVVKENKNTGGLLAQDEKQGVERLIEALQLVQWSNMEMA